MKPQRPVKLGVLELDGETLDLEYYFYNEWEDVSAACEEIPPIVEWVNMKLQGYTEQQIIKAQEIEEVEADVYFDLKAEDEEGLWNQRGYAGTKTDAAIKRAIARESKVRKVHEEYAVLEGWTRRLINLMKSLERKLELIRTTEATRRKLIT